MEARRDIRMEDDGYMGEVTPREIFYSQPTMIMSLQRGNHGAVVIKFQYQDDFHLNFTLRRCQYWIGNEEMSKVIG
jgi:hypothetical protein